MKYLGIVSIILSVGCFEPAKVVVGVEEGALTEEQLQALEDDCEDGNEEACEELDAIEEGGGGTSEPSEPNEEDSKVIHVIGKVGKMSTPLTPKKSSSGLRRPFKIAKMALGKRVQLEELEEVFEELIDECLEERNEEVRNA